MEVRLAPSFTSLADAVCATCRTVVTYDWSGTRYFLPDHLNSTNVVTDASGTQIQVLDYYPYGSTRISQTTGGFNEQKQYIAQFTDPETSLSYLHACYYNSTNGEFLSEDPVFLGDPKQQVLIDPQSLNSYSYGNDNPITKSDPAGKQVAAAAAPLLMGGGVALTPETLGVSLLLAGGVSALYLSSRSSPANLQDGAPALYQATKLVQGSGYNTDPELPSQPPKTPWGKVGFTIIASTIAIGALEDYCDGWCASLGQKAPFPGFAADGPITSLPSISIGSYGTLSATDRSACGTLCLAPQRVQMGTPAVSAPRSGSAAPAGTSSGGGSSGSRSGGGNSVSTWMGAFNPFQAH
jgi:RHS repeat-associated protein